MDKFIFGVVFGALGLVTLLESVNSYHKQASKAIQACEASLPRDQHCTIIALPVSKD
jgi:hypothetical protein